MTKTWCLAIVAIFAFSHPVEAQEFSAQPGQPFCADKDELHEFLLALVSSDRQWASALKTCTGLKGGSRILLIEKLGDGPGMSLIKARVFEDGGKTAVGYTIQVGE